MRLAVDSYLLPASKSRDTRIRVNLPTPIISTGGDSLWKWPNLRLSRAHDLDLGLVILHTVMHQLSTSTYIPNFIEIEETFCLRSGRRTFETRFIRLTQRSRPKSGHSLSNAMYAKAVKTALMLGYI